MWKRSRKRGIGAADPDLPVQEVAEVLLRLDALLHFVVVDDDVVEAGLPRRGGAVVIAHAHAALVVDGNGAQQLAVLARAVGWRGRPGPRRRQDRRREIAPWPAERGRARVCRRGKRRAGCGASAGPLSACTLLMPTGDCPAKVSSGQMAEAKRGTSRVLPWHGMLPSRAGGRSALRRGHAGGGEDDAVGALDDVGENLVERRVGGVAVVEVHVEDDALRRVVDQGAQDERVIEPRPGPRPVGRDLVDGDERELVAGRCGIRGERLAPVEERFLEGVERAGELRQQREDGPEQRKPGGERPAPLGMMDATARTMAGPRWTVPGWGGLRPRAVTSPGRSLPCRR